MPTLFLSNITSLVGEVGALVESSYKVCQISLRIKDRSNTEEGDWIPDYLDGWQYGKVCWIEPVK